MLLVPIRVCLLRQSGVGIGSKLVPLMHNFCEFERPIGTMNMWTTPVSTPAVKRLQLSQNLELELRTQDLSVNRTVTGGGNYHQT